MATPYVFKNPKIYCGAYDLSTALNEVGLAYAYDEVDITTFGDTCKHGIPGLPTIDLSMTGPGTIDDDPLGLDDILAAQLIVAQPFTIVPLRVEGATAKFSQMMPFSNTVGGTVGEAYRVSATGKGQSYQVIHGKVMATGEQTATDDGTAYELGAVTAAQKVYGCLHVLEVSGTNPTLDVIIESDDAEGMAAADTRLTFTQKTAVGAQFITPAAGAITDTWWRASWTIGGTEDPTFTFVVSVGIL